MTVYQGVSPFLYTTDDSKSSLPVLKRFKLSMLTLIVGFSFNIISDIAIPVIGPNIKP
jgi:hypothetical protein